MLEILKKYFGYETFRPQQEEIIEHIAKGADALVIMPTGGGKSLCFQLPALLFPGLTLVVSPLISLMKDQVDGLKTSGISAEYLNSSLLAAEKNRVESAVRGRTVKILYIAPERFSSEGFVEFLQNLNVSLIAIDEAHCISEWGHDFRPDYRNLQVLRQLFPRVPLVALTATATPQVQGDIKQQLGLTTSKTFSASFNRPNLHYSVLPKKNYLQELLDKLSKYKGESVIVYCFSRRDTERLAETLTANGFPALAYHAGLERENRALSQEKFIRGEVDIICATIAFGMGIDKPDVRLVAHVSLPKSIEGYYQETGRAGRDNLPSECLLFYGAGDVFQHGRFINEAGSAEEREKAWASLRKMAEYATTLSCRRKYLLNYFGEQYPNSTCRACDMCESPPEEQDATEITQKILSAILRTGSRFGKVHIMKILLGESSEKIESLGHDKLSVFGAGKDSNKSELEAVISGLISKGIISQTGLQYPILQVTLLGTRLLKERGTITLPKPRVFEERKRVKTRKAGGGDSVAIQYPDLYESLKKLRKSLADEKNIPPYVIFSNASLIDMAQNLPQDLDSFGEISGVGQMKLIQYGEKFLGMIKKYVEENNLEGKIGRIGQVGHNGQLGPMGRMGLVPKGTTYEATKRLVQEKRSIEEIVELRNMTFGTIIKHIEELVKDDEIDISYLRPVDERMEKIQAAFTKTGTGFLAPVREILGEGFSYEEIRLARLFIHINQ